MILFSIAKHQRLLPFFEPCILCLLGNLGIRQTADVALPAFISKTLIGSILSPFLKNFEEKQLWLGCWLTICS